MQPPRLDRIVRGRAWIPVLAMMLVAIVGLRVAVLKLGSGVGSQIQQATLLESSNATLRSQISALSDNQRIEKMDEAYGMHIPNPLDVHFVPTVAGTHLQSAINNISAPDNSTFLTGLAAEQHDDLATIAATAAQSAPATTSTTTTGAPVSSGSGTSATATSSSTAGTSVSGSTGGSAVTGQTAAGTSASTAGTSTGATTATDTSSSTNSAGATGGGGATLNTGPTNTDPGSGGSASAGSTSTGGTGLAG